MSIADEKTREITIKCVKGDNVEYNGDIYNYQAILCNDIPPPEIMPDLEVWRKYTYGNITRSKFLIIITNKFIQAALPCKSYDY